MLKFIKSKLKGTTLVLTLIILTVLSIVLGSLMEWQLVESRLTQMATSSTQSIIGSDALHETSIAQIDERLLDRATLDEDEFVVNPLTTPSDVEILSMLGLTPAEASVNKKDVTVSYIPTTSSIEYIDPSLDVNKYDPDKSKSVFSRYMMVFNEIEIDYTTKKIPPTNFLSALMIDAREDHLFGNAIFSDMDLVVLKPPSFKINGPVHTNGYLVLVPSNTNIEFDGIVTVAKDLAFPAEGGGQAVKFKTDLGFDTIDRAYTGTDWKQYALAKWDGWLQTGHMGIKERAPIGFAKSSISPNKFHGVIEPTKDATDANTNKVEESQKMASKAGIVFEIELELLDPSYDDGTGSSQFPAMSVLATQDPASYNSPAYSSMSTKVDGETAFDDNIANDKNSVSYRVFRYGTGNEVYRQESGNIVTRGKTTISSFPNINKIIHTTYDATAHPEMAAFVGQPIKMWDARRRLWIHVIDIDVGQLQQEVDSGSFPAALKTAWNGILYIHVLGKDGTTYKNIEDMDELDPHRRVGVRLINAATVPYKRFNGFTIATNAPLYLKGSFNSDDDLGTGSTTSKDPNAASFKEVPASIMADAVTFLSKNWVDRSSRGDVSRPGSDKYNNRETPADMEVSAGILTGYGVFNGGGINNLVRYLEMLDGKTVRIRGSLAALFQSKIAYEPFNDYFVYYPPNREFGMHDFFNDPNSPKFPPGDPLLRTWRKAFRQDISRAEFDELKTQLNQSLTSKQFKDKVRNIRIKYRDLGQ